MKKYESLLQHLSNITGYVLKNASFTPVYGGSINSCYHLKTDNLSWFIKINKPKLEAMFITEAEGLRELAKTQTLRTPKVITCGKNEQYAYLILEYLELTSLNGNSEQILGRELAQLHQQKQPFFGWNVDNFIGNTPQHNQSTDNWVIFWQQQRLAKQLYFAEKNGYRGSLQPQGEKLCENVGVFFNTYKPQASLVHGDLWSGNTAVDLQGQPVIFDSACYYADREVDLAMTELFGGFGDNFYAAYNNEWALDEGYSVRKILYNLYHILNHLNLFGESYARQANDMIARLLAEL